MYSLFSKCPNYDESLGGIKLNAKSKLLHNNILHN